MSDFPASAARNAPSLVRDGDNESSAIVTNNGIPNRPKKGGRHGREGSIKMSGEKVISVRRLWEEVNAKRTRTQLGASLLRYLFWLIIYLAAVYYQKNSRDAFRTADAFKDIFVRSSFIHPTSKAPMTFEDIRSVGDLWGYIDTKFVPTYYDLFWSNGDPKRDFYKNALLDKNRVAHGMRWTQRRGLINSCTATAKYNAFFPYCYPNIFDGGKQSVVDFGPYYDVTKYKYKDYNHRFEQHENGFVFVMPFNKTQTLIDLQTLKSDRWVDEATQWWQLDFTTYNPSTNLFAQVMLTIEFDTSGQVRPSSQVAIMRSQVYMEQVRDYIQIVLEIIVMIGLLMFLIGLVKDYLHFLYEGAPGEWFLGQFWVVLELTQLLLLSAAFFFWIIILIDPVRKDLKVKLGPSVDGKAGARDITKDTMTYFDGPLSLAPAHVQQRDYFIIQSLTVGLSMFRLLKYLAVNPLLGGLIETFIIVKVQLLQFLVIVVACNVAFAYMGVLMFGDVLAAFHTFDQVCMYVYVCVCVCLCVCLCVCVLFRSALCCEIKEAELSRLPALSAVSSRALLLQTPLPYTTPVFKVSCHVERNLLWHNASTPQHLISDSTPQHLISLWHAASTPQHLISNRCSLNTSTPHLQPLQPQYLNTSSPCHPILCASHSRPSCHE
jgi:hypothetical protein